jgi:RNA polymerase sigma factor (sigma-70 family)
VDYYPLSMDQKKDSPLSITYKKMDKDAFKLLYKEFYKAVFNHLYFSCKNFELSRDLTQETFFKLWEQREKIKDTQSLLPYLLKISKNLLLDFYRHNKVEQKYANYEVERDQNEDNIESQTHANILEEKIRNIVITHLSAKTSLFLS